MFEPVSPLGAEAPTATDLGAVVTEAGGNPSPVSEAQKPATGFASADPAIALAGAQVRVSGNFRSGAKHQDLLVIGSAESGTFTSGGGEAIAFAYDRATGVLTLSGAASAGAYDEAFEAVRLAIAGDDPDDGGTASSRTISYSIFDGAAYADSAEASLTVVAVNDAPTAEFLGIQAARLGSEIVVDTSSGSDREVSMTALADGGYLMTWTHSASMGGAPSVILAQRFDESGAAAGARIQIGGTGAVNSASAGFADGGFVVTWEGGGGLLAQRYDGSGAKLGGQIVVNPNNNNQELKPAVADLADGGFVVAWHFRYQDGSGEAILARRYDSAGVPQGAAVRVNSFTANDQHFPALAGLSDGGYVIIWTSWQQDAPGAGIYGQRFSAAGIAQGGEFRINATTVNNQQNPSVAALDGGGFVVTWSSTQTGIYDYPHIYAQRFGAAGTAAGGEIRVSSANAPGSDPVVTGLADGGFAIVWQSEEMYTRRYGADGQPVGPEAQVNTHVAGSQWHPAAAGLAGGDFVVGWADLNQGSGYSGVFQQRYTDGFAVDEGFALGLNGRISVDDVDAGSGSITVTLSVDHGDLFYVVLNPNAAVATGEGTSTLQITGTLADVKAFLGGDTFLGYQTDADAPPANANLTVRIEDSGGNGGDPLAAETVVVIGIVPVNDKPVLGAPNSTTLAFTEGDGPLALMQGVTVSDPDLPESFRSGGFSLSVTGGTGALQLRQGSAFQLTTDMYGNYVVSYQNGGSSVTAAYLMGIGTRTVSVTGLSSAMTPALTSDLIDDFVFTDSSDNPAAGNRTATLSFFDGRNLGLGTTPSAIRTQTVGVTPVNDAPVASYASGFGSEDSGRTWVFLQGSDPEGKPLTYTLASLPENGLLYTASTGGTPLAAGAVLAGSPSGNLSLYFQPNSNWSGSASFTFTLSDGSATTGPATGTITVTPVNDAPVFTIPANVNVVEQKPVVLLGGVTVSDVELDSRNGGAGDYSGSSLTVGRYPSASPEDQLTLVAGSGFTIDGSDIKAGGLTFATIVGNSNGTISIAFTGSQTPATRALVNDVIQNLRYTNASDAPPEWVGLSIRMNDGGATNGQGGPGAATGGTSLVVSIARVNDAPALDLNGAAAGATEIAYTENAAATLIAPGATVADPDSANFAQGQLHVTMGPSAQPYDRLEIVAQGSGPGQIGVGASGITYGGTVIATSNGGSNGIDLRITFNSAATPAAVQALFRAIAYRADTETPDSGSRPILFTLTDGDGGTSSASAALTIVATDEPAIARDDSAATTETSAVTGNVFADNGAGADDDPDGPALAVAAVNGSAAGVGATIALASGALVTLNADGTFRYDPNHAFDSLAAYDSGGSNVQAIDSFTYSLAGGGSGTVTVTVRGAYSAPHVVHATAGADTITGTAGNDVLHLWTGGADTVLAGAGSDNIFFGATLDAGDVLNGGDGIDTLVLQGPYGSLALTSNVTQIENISILGGGNTNFGDPGTNLYDYVLATHDANFAAGVQARINGAALLAGEDFTFNGSAETDAKFVVYGGMGVDTLTGGHGHDIFIYAEDRFAPGDTVNGGPGGYDGIFFRGNYTIDFNAPGYFGLMSGIENMTLMSITDERYSRGGDPAGFDYNITLADNQLLAGIELTVSGVFLMAGETMILDGSQETDGHFRLFAGRSNDTLKGGAQNDLLLGNLGADQLTGGGGADTFRYDSTADSNAASMDQILDFTPGTDKIELTRTDANALVAGDQAFTWIGSNGFTGTAGQLRAFQQGGDWILQGDTNGDGVADLVIALTLQGPTPLSSGDFFL